MCPLSRNTFICLLSLCVGSALATIQWQTTHNGFSSGTCRLESSSLRLLIYPYHIDVEEEAIIAPQGEVWSGDKNSLEISSSFTLSPGSAVRSMLLWNGSTILKAKLRDKIAADSLYEEVVDRQEEVFIPRDPALIEKIGPDTYRYKIYPVGINGSRRIRIRYSIPHQITAAGFSYEINTAFAQEIPSGSGPSKLSVECIDKRTSAERGAVVLHHGSTNRSVRFGTTYLLQENDLQTCYESYSYYGISKHCAVAPLRLTFDKTLQPNAWSRSIATGPAQGNYTLITTPVPDSLQKRLNERFPATAYTLEALATAGQKSWTRTLDTTKAISLLMKSSAPWNKTILWTAYDRHGALALEYTQTIQPDTAAITTGILPLLWASRYSSDEGSNALGAHFGFVDERMSLLALESDVLATPTEYAEQGVPLLLLEEIHIDPSQLAALPRENAQFDIYSTPIANPLAPASLATLFEIVALENGLILLSQLGQLPVGQLQATLFDLQGRVVQNWQSLTLTDRTVRLQSTQLLKGSYVLRLRIGTTFFTQQIVFK